MPCLQSIIPKLLTFILVKGISVSSTNQLSSNLCFSSKEHPSCRVEPGGPRSPIHVLSPSPLKPFPEACSEHSVGECTQPPNHISPYHPCQRPDTSLLGFKNLSDGLLAPSWVPIVLTEIGRNDIYIYRSIPSTALGGCCTR